MLLPATPGWALLPVVLGVPPHSWLRAPGAVPRHSWLAFAGGGGVRVPATPGWGLLCIGYSCSAPYVCTLPDLRLSLCLIYSHSFLPCFSLLGS